MLGFASSSICKTALVQAKVRIQPLTDSESSFSILDALHERAEVADSFTQTRPYSNTPMRHFYLKATTIDLFDTIYLLETDAAFLINSALLRASLEEENYRVLYQSWRHTLEQPEWQHIMQNTPVPFSSSESAQAAIQRMLYSENPSSLRNPYADSLALHARLFLFRNPKYQINIKIFLDNQLLEGILFYIPGPITPNLNDGYYESPMSYVAFETAHRIYLSQMHNQRVLEWLHQPVAVLEKKTPGPIRSQLWPTMYRVLMRHLPELGRASSPVNLDLLSQFFSDHRTCRSNHFFGTHYPTCSCGFGGASSAAPSLFGPRYVCRTL